MAWHYSTKAYSKNLLIEEKVKSIGRNDVSEARAVRIRTQFSWKRAKPRLVFPNEAGQQLRERVKNLPPDSAEARLTLSHRDAPEKDERISLWTDKRFSKTLNALKRGAQTMEQVANNSKQSTRTVARQLKELVKSGDVKRLDLRLSSGYPRDVAKVFYQINPLREIRVRAPFDYYVRKEGRFGTEPAFQKRLSPFGRSVVDEKMWSNNRQYRIKRPWSQDVNE
jgi:hypothetical protein